MRGRLAFLPRFGGSDSRTDYEYYRLNSSGQPSSKKYNLRKTALVVGLLFMFALVGYRYRNVHRYPALVETYDETYTSSPSTTHPLEVPHPTEAPNIESSSPDPNPLGTAQCIEPYTPGQSLAQYALMIDAGSTGSRIHIYKFHNCQAQPTYEYEVFRQRRPGLSAYAGTPVAAAESLDELFEEAMVVVPESLRACTPVAVKATAGLRLLGERESADILAAVHSRISQRYPFSISKEDSVVIMDGKEEGVYAWITANYLLHALDPTSSQADTYAVLDLGGASTQIVFKPMLDSDRHPSLLEGEHNYNLNFAGANHSLYQHSYLGFGLMAARKSVHRLVQFMASINHGPSDHGTSPEVANPCLSRGTSKKISFDSELNAASGTVTMIGGDVGSFDGCRRVVELVMAKDAVCQVKPCSFNGVYQPSLLDAFPSGNVLLLSYFYDRLQPLLQPGAATDSPISLKIGDIAELAAKVCEGTTAWPTYFGNNHVAMSELEGRPEYCLDLTFMYTLLRLGYEFDDHRDVFVGKQISGTELGWSLGAGIALVGARIDCLA